MERQGIWWFYGSMIFLGMLCLRRNPLNSDRRKFETRGKEVGQDWGIDVWTAGWTVRKAVELQRRPGLEMEPALK